MDLFGLVMLIGALGFVLIALFGIAVGFWRMTGHRSRFDGFYEAFARVQGARVYPPSLRGNPEPAIQEVVEVDRGDAAARSTPGESSTRA
jgi:hypothetical protein